MVKKMKVKGFKFNNLYQIKIYLKGSLFCKYKNKILLDEEEVDLFYKELTNDTPIMEFGGFYFDKSQFKYAKTKVKKIKVKE